MKMIDLFAGIGGIRLGFDEVFDAETVFTSEINEKAAAVYRLNFDTPEYIAGDITKIDACDIPAFNICLAGFPCQAFSQAGRRMGFEDNYKGVCRGTLFLDVVRICDFHKPEVIFCENVKGLVNHDHGNTFKIILDSFEEIGYDVFWKVINSSEFSAQKRQRVYIVCFRKDLNIRQFEFPTGSDTTVCRDILEDDVAEKYYLSERYIQALVRHRERHEAKGNGFGYQIIDLDGKTNAMTCSTSGRERNLIVDSRFEQHKNSQYIRQLTPRECFRLQGFSDSFKTTGSDTSLYKETGNSVTVPVVKAIAEQIKLALP